MRVDARDLDRTRIFSALLALEVEKTQEYYDRWWVSAYRQPNQNYYEKYVDFGVVAGIRKAIAVAWDAINSSDYEVKYDFKG